MNVKMQKMQREKNRDKSMLQKFDLFYFNRLFRKMCIKTIKQ